ncbi:hypothetical protein [Cupriavidus pauculus]|nr:hypothetical protein [Cupriavidus pauculus]GJG98272.1 hypothetical protein CBA19C6_27305 [Cupriavidus pauculus]
MRSFVEAMENDFDHVQAIVRRVVCVVCLLCIVLSLGVGYYSMTQQLQR